jgi:hypothetical protein
MLENLDFFYNIENLEKSTDLLFEMLSNSKNDKILDPSLIEITLVIIFNTSNYERQVKLINSILNLTNESFQKILLNEIISTFKDIPSNRKDKFFYYISKTYLILDLNEMLNVKDLEVLQYLMKMVNVNKNEVKNWDDTVFLNFLVNTKPFIAKEIKNIKIEKEKVQPFLELQMNKMNREVLYDLFSN